MMLMSVFLLFIQMHSSFAYAYEYQSSASLNFDRPFHHGIFSRFLSNHFDNNRNLEASFATLNNIFNEITLVLPDSNISSNGLDLTITELTCSNINVQDIQVGHTSLSDTTTRLAVNIIGLEITCNFRWAYKWTIFNGSGSGMALLDQASWASINLDFLSEDYNEYPPTDLNIEDCNAAVEIGDLEFDGDGLGFIASIINAFERLLRDRIEGEINTFVCSELKELGDGALEDILHKLSNQLDGYLTDEIQDSLLLESSIDIPRDENGTSLYLNFLDLDEYAGEWINSALDKLDSFLGGSNSDGEFGINAFIRDNFLDDGAFVVNPSDFMASNVIFESHDMLTETSMTIESIKIRGLDSFSELDLMNAIGNHTLKNSLKLKSLSLVVNMRAYMKPSSKSDAVIAAPNSDPIEEKFTVTVLLNEIDLDFSFLLALNTETLGNMQLGPLLHTQTIMQCLMSAAEILSFTELSISVADVVPPSLTGFLDSGIDKIVTKGAEALFDMYESVLLKAMPNFFHTFVREKLNAFVKNSLQVLTVCENDSSVNGLIDFRDLFLSPEIASSEGASGNSPYGNVVNWVWDLVNTVLFSANESGLLAMNDILIKPLTKAQSGQEGLVSFNHSLVDLKKEHFRHDIWNAFADHLRLGMSNLRLNGLDTFREPFHIIKPSNKSGHVLENHITLGIDEKSLDASFQFDIEVGGDDSPIATKNTMDLQVSLPSNIEVVADLFAAVDASQFMTMPLKNILNVNCWLSMMADTEDSDAVKLALHYFDMVFDDFTAKSSCISCSNKALKDFDEMMDFLDANNFFANVNSRGRLILSEILESDWMGGIFDSEIQAAALRCPSESDLTSSQIVENSFPFETSRQLVDGILYASMSVAQIIAVVLAQKHADVELPVDVAIELDVPADANLIDFTNLTNVASWADMALEEANAYLGSVQNNNEGQDVLGIVNILRSLILDDDGLFTINIANQGFEAGGVVLSLYNVSLIGLDSFTSFDVLNATGAQQLKNTAKLDTLGVSVSMGLSVGEGNELETITASLVLKDIELDVSFLVALDEGVLGDLKLGSIMDTSNIFYCIRSAIHTIGLSKFVMQIGDIEGFSLSGFMSKGTDESIHKFTQAIFAKYKSLVVDAFPAFTSTTIQPLLHNIFQVLMKTAKGGVCSPSDVGENDVVDFRDLFLPAARSIDLLGSGNSPYGDLFQMLFNFVEEWTTKTNTKGLSMMNDMLISKITDGGDMSWSGEVFRRDMDIDLNGLNANIMLAIKDVKLVNMDTIGSPVRIFHPVYGEGSILNNSMSIGVGPDPLRVSLTLIVSGEGDQIQVNNELELGLSLSSADLLLDLLAKMKETSLLNFPLRAITDMNCWLSTIVLPVLDRYGIRVGDKTIALEKMMMAVSEAKLDIRCISCSSPVLLEMSSYFESVEGVDDTTRVANMLLRYFSDLLAGDFIQNVIDKYLIEASAKCPHSQSYNPTFNELQYDDLESRADTESSYGFLWAILAVVLVMIVLSSVIIIAGKYINRRRHAQWMRQLTRAQVSQLAEEEKHEKICLDDIDLRMKSMVFSDESIPALIRFSMPVIILGNIALFLSGHLSLGGTVNISGQFAGQFFDIQGFFEFSMVNSTIEMWEAGAHSLAILIVIFSGLWPYSKQLTIFAVWFLPTSRLSSKRRGQILHWLDVLGKWSMVDVFVLLMSLASFRISIESPSHLSFLPEDLFQVQMMVIPLWGLYANMLAQIVSQISSHIIIHYHRKSIDLASQAQHLEWGNESLDANDTKALRNHHFKLDYEASTKFASIRNGVSTILAIFLVVFIVLVISGCALTSFSIETVGLLGLAVESMNQFQDSIINYSVFGLANMIMDEARYLDTASNYIGLGTLSALLVVTVFIVPIAQGLSLSIEWFIPMNKEQRLRNFVINEILSAWQYMEVFVLSVCIASWQLGGVSEYMINAYCGSLENLFNTLSFYGVLSESDAQCFRINAIVESATYMLVAASVFLSFANHFIMSASSQKRRDIETPGQSRFHSDRWLTEKHTMSLDEDESSEVLSTGDVKKISPVASRFTDFYPFATTRKENLNNVRAEDAILVEHSPEIETPVQIETNAFWDVVVNTEIGEDTIFSDDGERAR